MLTKNEKMLLADALNGCYYNADDGTMEMMAGQDGAVKDAAVIGVDTAGRVLLTGSSTVCSGLELEVYDSIRLNELDEKWEIDGVQLLTKIRAMSKERRIALLLKVKEVWARNDERFEADLEALEV